MGTMSNTLILAFAGGSINTFVYIYSYNYQYYQVLDMYSIGIEIIQGISATLGVILTVPIVSAISAVALKKTYNKLGKKSYCYHRFKYIIIRRKQQRLSRRTI